MRNLTFLPGGETEVCRECDGFPSPCDGVRFGRDGLVFDSPREIEPMSDLVILVEWSKAGRLQRRARKEGVVVDCRKMAEGCFEITVLFLAHRELCVAEASAHLQN